MSQTVIGIFEYTNQAQEAKAYLLANGFTNEYVDITTGNAENGAYQNTTTNENEEEGFGDRIGNFFRNLFGDEDDSTSTHIEAGRRGTIVTVHAQTSQQALEAAQILDNFGAVDVNEYAERSRNTAGNTDNFSSGTSTDATTTGSTTGAIPVIEEELQVGKREVETGGVRLRSRIVERPVEESIRLREEHVNVERTPVDRPATEADFAGFKEGTVEVTEHAERPVVAKEARVVEEVSLDKEVTEREETINDTVRHTEIDTENTGTSGNAYTGTTGTTDYNSDENLGITGTPYTGGTTNSTDLDSDEDLRRRSASYTGTGNTDYDSDEKTRQL